MKELLIQIEELLTRTGDDQREFWEHIVKTQKLLGNVAEHYWDDKNFEGDIQLSQKCIDIILSGMIMLIRTKPDYAVLENMIPTKLKYWEEKAKDKK